MVANGITICSWRSPDPARIRGAVDLSYPFRALLVKVDWGKK